MSSPFYSLIVPTKNRAELLPTLIESVLSQEYENFELLIIDNDDIESSKTQIIVSQYSDTRIKYHRTGGLSMAENWNYGYSKASGDFMIVMRDKYVLKPHSLVILNHYVQKYNPEVISWRWNSVNIQNDDWKNITGSFEVKCHSNTDYLNWFFEMGANYLNYLVMLPIGANTCLSRNLCNRILSHSPQLCFENAPDYALGSQILFYCDTIYHLDLSLCGSFEHRLQYSTGNLHDMGQLKTAIKMMGSKSTSLDVIAEQPLDMACTETIIIEDFLRLAKINNQPYTFENFNCVGYYSTIYSQTIQRFATAISLYNKPNSKYFKGIRRYIKSSVQNNVADNNDKQMILKNISHSDKRLFIKIILIKGYKWYNAIINEFLPQQIKKGKSKYFN